MGNELRQLTRRSARRYFICGVAPPAVTTRHIDVGVIPFVLIQPAMLVALWFLPGLATWLPHRLYGS